MDYKQLLAWGCTQPRRLFLVDGLGAIVSAVLLGIVLVRLESVFGIPRSALYILASFPCVFTIYDFYCFFKVELKLGIFLRGIAVANLLYCCLSVGLAIYHASVISHFGWAYILVEILVLIILSLFELSVSRELIRQSDNL